MRILSASIIPANILTWPRLSATPCNSQFRLLPGAVMIARVFVHNMKYSIFIMCLLLITAFAGFGTEITSSGYLNVNSDPLGLKVYLDGDSIGYTPIRNYLLKPGEYTVSLFSSDTIESQYWKLSNGGLGDKYSALSDLAKAGAGTKQVVIKLNQASTIFFSLHQVNHAPNKIKLYTACCIGAGFTISFLIGFLVASLVQ